MENILGLSGREADVPGLVSVLALLVKHDFALFHNPVDGLKRSISNSLRNLEFPYAHKHRSPT